MNRIERIVDEIVERTSDAIRRQIGTGRATLTSIARELAISARTLQRRLHDAHTSFAALLTAVRIEIAREALGRGVTVTQLAPALGFSESSAVSRFLRDNGFTLPALRAQGRARSAGIKSGDFDAIVETIYNDEGPERWSNAAAVAAPYLESPMIRVWVMEGESPDFAFDAWSPAIAPDALERYDQRYFADDPRMRGTLARLGNPVSCIDVVDPAEFDKSALVNDILDRPEIDARWTMLQAQRLGSGRTLFLGAARPRRQGPHLEPDKRRLNMIFGHFRRALDFELRVPFLNQKKRALEETLDLISEAVVVVSRDLDVLYANRRGAELIVVDGSLRIAHGKLQAVHAREQSALEGIVAAAAGDGGAMAAGIISAREFRILARAFRLPRSHFVGRDSDWQCALMMTTMDPRATRRAIR